jgi:amylosucrase
MSQPSNESFNSQLLEAQFFKLYPQSARLDWDQLKAVIHHYKSSRREALKKLDLKPTWFQDAAMVGVTLYVDLFVGTLKDLKTKVDYFVNLGITYIHLMPLLKTREGNNDGGYAVSDYKSIEPRLGTIEEFTEVIEAFQEKNIAIAIDFVINHTAKEHAWAKAALNGDSSYQQYYMMYDSDVIPNQFNQTVPEVLPDVYPGNFTYYPEIKKYVFKSFSEFQWDLNFANPKVLIELVDIFLFLANTGVRMIRLDAIPFIWKTLGTSCRNLPEVHIFMHFFQLLKREVCPGVAILGEAIVEPHEIYKYFGTANAPECDVLYNATLMVNIWEALATQDGRLLKVETDRFPLPNHATWINYVRCHDDIGWGFNEAFIQQTGRDPFAHKQFLISFYNGSFPGSYAKGKNYQENPRTGDARTNGTLASLIGFEQGFLSNDEVVLSKAFDRFTLIHNLMYTMPGMPLIYSGDEWLQLNDYDHLKRLGKTDGRWLHRPQFEKEWFDANHPKIHRWRKKAFHYLQLLNDLRKRDARFHSSVITKTLDPKNDHVFAFSKQDNKNPLMVAYFNFSQNKSLCDFPFNSPDKLIDLVNRSIIKVNHHQIILEPYQSFIVNVLNEV